MESNIPEIVAEVTAAFNRYEAALVANDVPALDSFLWNDPRVIRYALFDNGYGFEAIMKARRARPNVDLRRQLMRTVVTTFGRDFATANTEFKREESGREGRQSQTWVRTSEGWKIVSAHVSWLMPPP
jgi:1-carboxybiuret hydrolase subunit AtzH-like protein